MERNWVIWEQDKLCQRIYKVKLDDQAVSEDKGVLGDKNIDSNSSVDANHIQVGWNV